MNFGRRRASAHWPAPDFVRRRPRPLAAWALLVAGAVMAGFVAWQAWLLWQARLDELVALARLQRVAAAVATGPGLTLAQPGLPPGSLAQGLPVGATAPARTPTVSQPQPSATAAWRVVDALRYPWPGLMAAVDEGTLPGVQWLGWQHQAGQPVLQLEGLVPDADVAASLVSVLAERPGWSGTVLARLSRAEGPQASAGLRFEITAQVRGAAGPLGGMTAMSGLSSLNGPAGLNASPGGVAR